MKLRIVFAALTSVTLVAALHAQAQVTRETVDGVTNPMTLRVPAGNMPLRPSNIDTTLAMAMTSGNTKASIFTNSVCETLLPAGAHAASVAGKSLPLPKPVVNRVAIIGDTGCRIAIGNVYQACGDPAIWPFSVMCSQPASALSERRIDEPASASARSTIR